MWGRAACNVDSLVSNMPASEPRVQFRLTPFLNRWCSGWLAERAGVGEKRPGRCLGAFSFRDRNPARSLFSGRPSATMHKSLMLMTTVREACAVCGACHVERLVEAGRRTAGGARGLGRLGGERGRFRGSQIKAPVP